MASLPPARRFQFNRKEFLRLPNTAIEWAFIVMVILVAVVLFLPDVDAPKSEVDRMKTQTQPIKLPNAKP